ncbi:hypothetical protein [Streptacidiphilus cavernicola]|uniref:Uncharacterized protein n=1 Tax=Streptacidiphilus cavernicola TaxID=3342716 RepID=A0ABV6VYA6_9ACTN
MQHLTQMRVQDSDTPAVLARTAVLEAAAVIDVDPGERIMFGVLIAGRLFPLIRLVSIALTHPADYAAQDAARALRDLGFQTFSADSVV